MSSNFSASEKLIRKFIKALPADASPGYSKYGKDFLAAKSRTAKSNNKEVCKCTLLKRNRHYNILPIGHILVKILG